MPARAFIAVHCAASIPCSMDTVSPRRPGYRGTPLRTGTWPERCSTEPVMWKGFMVP